MSRHPYTLVESFYCCPRQPDVQSFMYQLKRDTVIMTGHFYVVIQLDLSLIPFGILVVSLWQRLSIGSIQCFKQLPAGFLYPVQKTGIESLQTLSDRGVKLCQTVESTVA